MLINMQGFGHFQDGINNQDFGIETKKMLLILDGCSEAIYSESGTRIFAQIFSTVKNYQEPEKFEENIKSTFDKLIFTLMNLYPTAEKLQDYIMDNLLFTIVGCFDTKDEFIVKIFGDGYILTKNIYDNISFIKLSYGKRPPYFAYKYCNLGENNYFKSYEFKTFKFKKSEFKNVGIATDGIMPIAKGNISNIEKYLFSENKAFIENSVRSNRVMFYDDVTMAFFTKEEL